MNCSLLSYMTNCNVFIQHIQRGAQNINGKVLFKGKTNGSFFLEHPVYGVKCHQNLCHTEQYALLRCNSAWSVSNLLARGYQIVILYQMPVILQQNSSILNIKLFLCCLHDQI